MSTALKSGTTATRIGLAANHETIVTIKRGALDRDTIELRFETLFAGAKDPAARQVKAQFFLSEQQLLTLNQDIRSFLGVDTQMAGQHHRRDCDERFGSAGTDVTGADVGSDESGAQ
jgi:hypothetical protein